jgi:sodium/proline symporter
MATTIAFAIYAIVIVGIGLYAAFRPQETASEVHLGGREHGTWAAALSASASTESGFVLLGMVGVGYNAGVNALWIVPAGVLGYLLLWVVLAPNLWEETDEHGAVTVPELISQTTDDRFSKYAAALGGVFAIIFLLAYVAAQISAAGKSIESQFELSYITATSLTAGFVTAYAMLGGFRAVSWTDTVQALMMLFALVILPITIITDLGGLGAVFSKLHAINPDLTSLTGGASTAWGSFVAIFSWLMLALAYPGQPHAVARIMASKDREVLRRAPYVAIPWFIIIYTGAVLLGMSARVGFSGMEQIASDPEQTLPVLAVEILPGVLGGVVLAAVVAAITSTADSTLIASASTALRDLRKALNIPEPAHEAWWMRGTILTLGAVASGFAFQETGLVFDIVLISWAGLGASLGPAVLYSALADRPKGLASLCGIITGGTLAFVLQQRDLDLLMGFIASGIVILAVHWVLTERDAPETSAAEAQSDRPATVES